jgi:hypothetical protein
MEHKYKAERLNRYGSRIDGESSLYRAAVMRFIPEETALFNPLAELSPFEWKTIDIPFIKSHSYAASGCRVRITRLRTELHR